MKKIILISIAACSFMIAAAQKKEQQSVLTEFINVCNAYKQFPLQLSLEYKKRSAVAEIPGTETGCNADFYISQSGAYIRFGDFEQVVSDSIVLVIMGDKKQMVLSANDRPVADALNTMMGSFLQNPSMKQLAEKYIVEKIIKDKRNAVIEIRSKETLFGTSIPFQVIQLDYSTETMMPGKVTSTKRNLVRVEDTLALPVAARTPGNLFSVPGEGFFIKQEEVSEFIYKKIGHERVALPVIISDRLTHDVAGNYTPAKAYSSYMLFKNL